MELDALCMNGKKVCVVAAEVTITARSPRSGEITTAMEASSRSSFPGDVTNFSSTISRFKPRSRISSGQLVGGAHISFSRQWAAKVEQKHSNSLYDFRRRQRNKSCSPEEADGMLVGYNISG
jgi:hypothetical protein